MDTPSRPPRFVRARRAARILALTLGLPGATLALAGLLADRIIAAEASRVVAAEAAPEAPVAIVLGAGVREGGRLTAVLEDRVAVAADLYRRGRVRRLLLSGDHGRKGYDEPTAMARRAEALGVAPGDIFLDHAGFDTYATVYRARDVFRVQRALIVTQGFHLPRALYLARRLGIEAWGVSADLRPYRRATWYAVREVGARLRALWMAEVTRPTPRFLGPAHPIEGQGFATRDGS